jgi:hypothetical protein
MSDKAVGMVVFVLSFCMLIYFLRASWRAFISQEFKGDLQQLRQQRRQRKAARRRP